MCTDPPCSESPSGDSYYCGQNLFSATFCKQPCPSGLNGECPYGEQCYNVDTCADETESPTSAPSAKARLSVRMVYTFCMEHGILTPYWKIERRTSESITKTLMSKFLDDTREIEPRWEVDETHFLMQSVETVKLPDSDQGLDCK